MDPCCRNNLTSAKPPPTNRTRLCSSSRLLRIHHYRKVEILSHPTIIPDKGSAINLSIVYKIIVAIGAILCISACWVVLSTIIAPRTETHMIHPPHWQSAHNCTPNPLYNRTQHMTRHCTLQFRQSLLRPKDKHNSSRRNWLVLNNYKPVGRYIRARKSTSHRCHPLPLLPVQNCTPLHLCTRRFPSRRIPSPSESIKQ